MNFKGLKVEKSNPESWRSPGEVRETLISDEERSYQKFHFSESICWGSPHPKRRQEADLLLFAWAERSARGRPRSGRRHCWQAYAVSRL